MDRCGRVHHMKTSETNVSAGTAYQNSSLNIDVVTYPSNLLEYLLFKRISRTLDGGIFEDMYIVYLYRLQFIVQSDIIALHQQN